MSMSTARGRRMSKPSNVVSEMKSIYLSSWKAYKDLGEYLKAFDDLAKRADVDSQEFVCPKCRMSLTAQDGKSKHNEEDINQIADLQRELINKNLQIRALNEKAEGEQRKMRNEIEKQRQEIENLKALNNELRRKGRKRILVNIHTTLKPSLSVHIVQDIMSHVSSRLQSDDIDVEQRQYDGSHDVTGPVVAICINVSRLGTDVQDVIKNIKKDSQDVVVLVLHHKEVHALPNQNTDRILTGSEYKNLGAIIDVAFLTNKGMYPCEMNDLAVGRLISFLLKYKIDS